MTRASTSEGFHGVYFDGKTSRAHLATVTVRGTDLVISWEDGQASVPVRSARVEPALGGTTRVIHLPGDARIETDDATAIAVLEEHLGQNRALNLVGRLERHWRHALVAAVILIATAFAIARYGLPVAADWAANTTPASALGPASDQALALLDAQGLRPTRLAASEQARLQKLFARVSAKAGPGLNLRLLFRDGGAMGANAFALPNGTIVVTDQFLDLARNNREVAAVLAHEIGHVQQRHALRGLYRSAGVALLVSILLGDVASASNLAASLPAVLLERGYSRGFEVEADAHAAAYLNAEGWGTQPLRGILERLADEHGSSNPGLLSTHPGTEQRIERLEELERLRGR
ncbi:MAG TPA: M48 family metallopeptidase [Deinococcales bacterium]|nr:M48 family metallopeptidase [Deinococcales bacterium]